MRRLTEALAAILKTGITHFQEVQPIKTMNKK